MMDAEQLRFWLRRPIAFHRVFADLAGGATGGLFLSQLLYWSDRGSGPDGWIYKTQDEWQAETALTRYEQERARKVLREVGVLQEERRGVPSRLFYRLDIDALATMLESAFNDAGTPQASMRDVADKDAESRSHSPIAETTAENTQTPVSIEKHATETHAERMARIQAALRRGGPGRR